MKLRTAIFLISVSTFNSCYRAYANFSEKTWTYHGPHGDLVFEKCGGDLGSPLVSLDEIEQKLSLKRVGKKKDFTLQKDGENEIRLSTRYNKVFGKGWTVDLSEAPRFVKNGKKTQVCVPLDFGDRGLTPLLNGQKPAKWDEHLEYTSFAQVVIDPGHGGNDWGTLGVYKDEALKEKDLTLEFAKELEGVLKEKSITVALTRNRDDFVALSERSALVNKLNPKLFLSLHLNSNGASPGFEIFTLSMFKRDRKALEEIGTKISKGKEKALLTFKSAAKQELSISWAADIKKVLSKYVKPVAAGLRREPFYLLYAVDSPGILVELGYMDREEDLRFWLNKSMRRSLWNDLSQVIDNTLKQKTN
jgi:N-acetylmuramoyl-L-alanine amidase